jgi:hypothetical protein
VVAAADSVAAAAVAIVVAVVDMVAVAETVTIVTNHTLNTKALNPGFRGFFYIKIYQCDLTAIRKNNRFIG